jgi:hypothetical protein
MKNLIRLLTATTLLALALAPATAAEKKDKDAKKDRAYPLEVCLVSDEKLGDMGDPFVFSHKGQEIKLCCKSCKKDFDKDQAKFMTKLGEEEKKAKKDKPAKK